MKEAIGGIPIFQIVVVFILLFTAVMCLTINHSKAYGVKDEIITIIEAEGLGSNSEASSFKLNDEVTKQITEHLNAAGYRITGKCPVDEGYFGYDRNGNENNQNAAYCVRVNRVDDDFYEDSKKKCSNSKCIPSSKGFPTMIYYDVMLFYQLDIPIFRQVFNFKLLGSTKILFG